MSELVLIIYTINHFGACYHPIADNVYIISPAVTHIVTDPNFSYTRDSRQVVVTSVIHQIVHVTWC